VSDVTRDQSMSLAYDHCRACEALELVRKLTLWEGASDYKAAALVTLANLAKAIEEKQGEITDEKIAYVGAPPTLEREERVAAGRCVECGADGGYVRGPHHYSDCSRKKRGR